MIGESEFEQDVIFHSSALHDIGKIGIPDSILLKPGPLSDDAFVSNARRVNEIYYEHRDLDDIPTVSGM
jgi:response regulator RpfG family c-di-GMP phosphodiesterase